MDNHLDENQNSPVNTNNKNYSFLSKKHLRQEESKGDNIINEIIGIIHKIETINENQIAKEKERLIKEIEEDKKKLESIEKFEQIKKQLNIYLKSSLYMNSEIKDITSDNNKNEVVIKNIKKLMNSYWKNNKEELKPFYQSLNQQYQKSVIKELEVLQNDVLKDYIQASKTIIIPNNKNIENKINNNNYIINQKNIIDKGETKDNKNQHIIIYIVINRSLN